LSAEKENDKNVSNSTRIGPYVQHDGTRLTHNGSVLQGAMTPIMQETARPTPEVKAAFTLPPFETVTVKLPSVKAALSLQQAITQEPARPTPEVKAAITFKKR
jgi:hypothetical protein